MPQLIKRLFWIVLLAAGLQSSWGFSVIGRIPPSGTPDNSWQTASLGYSYATTIYIVQGSPEFLGDIGTPKNFGEGYRRDVPQMYYTFDQTFLNYFGADGATAVGGAFGIMNSIPFADKINLSLYPDQTMQNNYTAMGSFLTDIKSVTLHLLVEQMGLADSPRFVWTLHDRNTTGTLCPQDVYYQVVQRNYNDSPFSPVNNNIYSSYINDILYTYIIQENCPPSNPVAYTVPFSTDPEAQIYTPVAANSYDGYGIYFIDANGIQPTLTSGGLQIGSFYSGLTRDDVAGLKWLYTTNRVNYEQPDPTALWFSVTTNLTTQQLLPVTGSTNAAGTFGFYSFSGNVGYGDYGALISAAQTNSPATLQAAYQGLVIDSSSNYFVLATNWIFTQYYTNSGYGAPYPPVLTLVTVSNAQRYLQQRYVTKFANVFPYKTSPNTISWRQLTVVTQAIGAPVGSPLITNTTTTRIVQAGVPSGGFFILPLFHTNVCPLDILYTGLTNVIYTTNLLTSASTNVTTTTGSSSNSASLSQIYAFTNYTFVINPVTCAEVAAPPNLYQGIGGCKFQRADYDSLIGQFFNPITNYYTMVALTNSHWQTLHMLRVVTRPDFLLQASDMDFGGVSRNISFTPSPNLNGLAGPGTINTPSTFSYNKIGDAWFNGFPVQTIGTNSASQYLGEYGALPALAWASYDASTNAPELYPNWISLQNLQSQLVAQLAPGAPPDGSVGSDYSFQFSANSTSFTPPFTWSALNSTFGGGISGLPPGLALTSGGLLWGTPTNAGTYDFTLLLNDSLGHSVQWNLSITIH